ncbi:tetratricopeptide repeat protein, partial [Flavobacteriales bacterium]|nr:tetratricopeptide repeat protein [Flavobacteriales bacterium]
MLSLFSSSSSACPKAPFAFKRCAQSGIILAAVGTLLSVPTSSAQSASLVGGEVTESVHRKDPSNFDRARHHFDHHQYAAAIELFDAWVQEPAAGDGAAGDRKALMQVEAEYSAALCAMYLYHKDAVWRIDRFIEKHPESTWVPKLQWALANYEYRRRKWAKSIDSFDALNPRRLSKSMRTEYHFKRGHARFETGDLEGARGDLLRVKEDPAAQPEFLEASEYYLAHIAFAEDRLTTALEAFEALSAIDAFKDAVPLYIGQILYRLERFDEL